MQGWKYHESSSFLNSARGHEPEETEIMHNNGEYRSPAKRADDSLDDLTKDARSLLQKALIDPVRNVIEGTKLIIVPQSCIFFVPFSSLIDENGCLLSQKYQIQIIPSIHVLASSMQASSSKRVGVSLFVGNPRVEDAQLRSLPSAEEEVKYLASLLDAKPLTGQFATKKKVMNLMCDASIIHIAAHGVEKTGHIFLAPEESTQAGDRAHSTSSYDLLTQSDVLDCKLSARLVVLSCCNSAHGKLSSEGVLGIARSFLGAGASSVLVTLWKINDKFTTAFMKVFYAKICEEEIRLPGAAANHERVPEKPTMQFVPSLGCVWNPWRRRPFH